MSGSKLSLQCNVSFFLLNNMDAVMSRSGPIYSIIAHQDISGGR